MKALLLCLALVLSTISAHASELQAPADWLGVWALDGKDPCCGNVQIEFKEDGSVALTRGMANGKPQVHVATPVQVVRVHDLLVMTFNEDGEIRYRLVLSGWKLPNTKMIFGTLYMYNKNAVFNGIPLFFRQNVAGT